MVWIYLIFSFTHWRTSWLLSAFGSYEQSCRKHPCADLYVDLSFSAPLDKYQGVGLLEPGSGCLILQETRFYQTSFLVLLHHYYYLLWFFFFFFILLHFAYSLLGTTKRRALVSLGAYTGAWSPEAGHCGALLFGRYTKYLLPLVPFDMKGNSTMTTVLFKVS